jgi:hypothetical protein
MSESETGGGRVLACRLNAMLTGLVLHLHARRPAGSDMGQIIHSALMHASVASSILYIVSQHSCTPSAWSCAPVSVLVLLSLHTQPRQQFSGDSQCGVRWHSSYCAPWQRSSPQEARGCCLR